MSQAFEALRERLLRAGVGRGRTDRYVAELSDHLLDLIMEERDAGASPEEASARAMARLGNADDLAEAMIARREFKAWSARAPALAWLAAPTLVLVAATAAWAMTVVGLAMWLRTTGGPDMPAWMRTFADAAAVFGHSVLPLLLAWGLAGRAIRNRAPAFWPVLGLLTLAFLSAAIQLDLTLPAGAARGELTVNANLGGSLGPDSFWSRLTFNLAAMAAPYVVFAFWRAAHARPGRV